MNECEHLGLRKKKMENGENNDMVEVMLSKSGLSDSPDSDKDEGVMVM